MTKGGQIYYQENKPASNSPKDLFAYCLRTVIQKNLLSRVLMHNQWAGLLFSYLKSNFSRIDLMSKVKREYSTYFTSGNKYSFNEEKLKRDFPSYFGIEDGDDGGEYTSEDLVRDTIKVLNHEIIEQKDPDKIESYDGKDLSLVRKQGKSYIYLVKIEMSDGQEPHFHDSLPFTLKVYGKSYNCEEVDFDYESGLLYFTTTTSLNPASYCKILLDSSFILEGLRKRLDDLITKGVDENLPFAKFIFGETEELTKISHKQVPSKYIQALDESQKKAFNAALDNDLTFIWGPPGTGKSYTLASIIYALYQLGEDRTAVCCLSNVAVDQLLGKLLDVIKKDKQEILPGNIYRAGRTLDERIISTDYLFPKDNTTEELRMLIKDNIKKIQELKECKMQKTERFVILKAENKELREKLKEHTDYLVNSSRLVFSTMSNFILSNNLYDNRFDNLIIDEASMLSQPSLLALGCKISKRLIMVGDFQQLSPIAIVKDEILQDSVFEMSGIDIKHTAHPALHQLLNQRRSNSKIVDLINKTFYEGKLIPAAKDNLDVINSEPFAGRVIALQKVTDGAVKFTKGGTRQNKVFAENVMALLDEYSQDTSAHFSIGVITPYRGQVSLLKALKFERKYPEAFDRRVKIGTIHTFQGSECDVIIYDMVECPVLESGKPLKIGKLYHGKSGERLLNVAVSRAKHKLIVVCDPVYIRNISGNKLEYGTINLFNKLSRY